MKNLDSSSVPDPTKTSVVNVQKEEIIHKDNYTNSSRPIWGLKKMEIIEDSTGRRFYRGKESLRSGQNQMLLARMLKGIIPVSDIVYIKDDSGKGSFYSYEIPLENLNKKSSDSLLIKEEQVDDLILMFIFHDWDHYESLEELVNTRRTTEGKYVFFDFQKFDEFWHDKVGRAPIYKKFEAFFAKFDKSQRVFLNNRFDELLKRFEGKEGLNFLKAIVNSIPEKDNGALTVIQYAPGKDTETKILSFQSELIKRIRTLKNCLLKDYPEIITPTL